MKRLLAGCGVYLQGPDALQKVGVSLGKRGYRKIFLIAGRKAFGAAESRLMPELIKLDGFCTPTFFGGHCTAEEITRYANQAQKQQADCIVGLGGGKVMDLAKAAADEAGLPVFEVPASAATCAAYAPLSVVYNSDGTQHEIRFFDREVDGVFVDTQVIAQAPPRLLAAGLVDAMAKACEYATMMPHVAYGTLPMGKYLGFRLAEAADEAIAVCALPAMESVHRREVSPFLEDAVCCTIACTGIVSGLGGFDGRGGARFAIAHAFNEALRGKWFSPHQWLHGEVVAVGILAQMHANGNHLDQIAARRELFSRMGVPVTLKALSPTLSGEGIHLFEQEILRRIQVSGLQEKAVLEAIDSVTD